ncbi:MAG: lytic transglycosylase domain-containing protein [Candidatus Hydrogenedentes bacterium]|nr:lytic transglycosylase domain-containing protein [Candidatus Hydrogenedentota bacterium]
MHPLLGLRQRAAVGGALLLLVGGPLWAETPVIGNVDQTTREELIREMEARREAIQRRRGAENLRAFINEEGVLTLTNKLGKYRSDPGYTEIDLDYEPIVVAKKYKRYTSPTEYDQSVIESLVAEYAKQYSLQENLVYAVIRVESNGDPNAVSHAGARGLMQLMPGTAKEMGVTNIIDPAQNIAGGAQYLSKLVTFFEGDVRLALAGYNAGPENVRKYGGIPPFRETQNYVRDVLHWWRVYNSSSTRPEYLYGAPKSLEEYRRKTSPLSGTAPVSQMASHRAEHEKSLRLARAEVGGVGEYTVHFTNGASQPADKIIPGEDHYYIQYQGVTKRVRKEHVETIS